MSKRILLWLITACFFVAGSAHGIEQGRIARLLNITGDVLVAQSERFVPAQPGMLLRVGDRVVVLDRSGARIVSGGRDARAAERECDFEVNENSIVQITNKANCNYRLITLPTPSTAQAQSQSLSEADLLALPIVRCDLFSCLAPEN